MSFRVISPLPNRCSVQNQRFRIERSEILAYSDANSSHKASLKSFFYEQCQIMCVWCLGKKVAAFQIELKGKSLLIREMHEPFLFYFGYNIFYCLPTGC